MQANELRTPEERTRYVVAAVLSVIVWLGLLLTIVGALYGLFIVLFVMIGHALWLAYIAGNGVRVTEHQMPALWARVETAARKLGLERTPEVYVLQAGGALNAMATKLLSRRFVIIYSDLIDSCEAMRPSLGPGQASRPTELDFVIAHELGHIACNHLSWALLPARLIPLLGPAYSRACEYTCDACGHAVVQDLEVSCRALGLLAGGVVVGKEMNLEQFSAQRREGARFWTAVYELNASHPLLTKRVARLRDRARPGTEPAPGRPWLAYPIAPMFGAMMGGAAGAMTMVAILGIMAALAIPAFIGYTKRAREAEATAIAQQYGQDDLGALEAADEVDPGAPGVGVNAPAPEPAEETDEEP